MRRFRLKWAGGAVAAEGVKFTDGTVAVRRVSGVSSTAAYLTVEVVTEDYSTATVEWIDQPSEKCCVCHSDTVVYHNYQDNPFCGPCADGDPLPAIFDSLVIGWRPENRPGLYGVRCLDHPYQIVSASPITRTDLKDGENCTKPGCGYNLRNHLNDPGALGTREEWLEKLNPVDLDSLVIGYQAERADGLVTLFRCLSDPFIVTATKWITRTDLPDGGTCSRCGADLLAFLDDPTRLCTLDRWEQARTAEPPEYREHVAGCTKLYYHPDACWPVEG